jgi:glycosyltransferase involved in cell wall biosynthesis
MKNQQLRIAFLGNQIAWGGAAKSLLLLIKSLTNQNDKLYLFVTHCSSQEMKKEFEQYVEFVKLVNLPEITSAQTQSLRDNKQNINEKKLDLTQIELFAEELNHLGIDILHINNSVFSAVYKTVRSRTNIKIVSHIREWIDWNGIHQKQKFIIDSIKNNSDAIICISNTEAQVFKQHPNLYIIPNPFDFQGLEYIDKNLKSIKSRLGIAENIFLVGMVGSFQRNKGALDFLKALAYLKKNKNNTEDLKFIVLGGEIDIKPNAFKQFLRKILGRNTFHYEVYKFLKKENLFNEVIFLSNRINVLEIANCFDVAIRPSYSGDPWGRDIIEYMALRKPIVATGSSDFFIKNGETGFLVPPGDYIGLAEKIFWLYKNKKERTEIGQKAFDRIFTKSNMEVFRSNILQVYNAVIVFRKVSNK